MFTQIYTFEMGCDTPLTLKLAASQKLNGIGVDIVFSKICAL